jgi:uncharacterized protein (DUF302 family)
MATKIMRSRWAVGAVLLSAIGPSIDAQTPPDDRAVMREVSVERFSVVSTRRFDEVLSKIEAAVGHPDMPSFLREISAARSEAELEEAVNRAAGPAGLIEFNRFDLGGVLRKEQGEKTPQIVRLLIGNPLIMKQMVKFVPDAGSYAPVTILIDQRQDGVHLSYDTMVSFLAPYRSQEASHAAQDLDLKIETLIRSAAF